MKYIVCFLILSISQNCIAQRLPKFERFEIDIDAQRTNFFEAIEDIEITRLEETINSLVPSMKWYFKTPNGFGIPMKKDKPYTVALFDTNGNYKNVINNYGQGPNEYININDVWFHDGKIELFSGGSRTIMRYSEDGNYIETLKAGIEKGVYGGEMIPYEEGYIFQQISPNGPAKVIAYDGLHFLDKKLNIIGKGARIDEPMRAPYQTGMQLNQLGQSIFYKHVLNDTVFQVIDREVYPKFKFDFGNDWAWADEKSNSSLNEALSIVSSNEKVWDVLSTIGKDYILITYHLYVTKLKGVIDRETGSFTRFDTRKKNKEEYDIKFHEWENNRLVGFISAFDFEEFLENLEDDQWSVKGGFDLDEILSSENPVLLKIKFKDK